MQRRGGGGATTFRIMTLSIATFSEKAFFGPLSLMTLIITTLALC